MTLEEAKAIIDALVTLRNSAEDEQALKASALYPKWKVSTDYQKGERVLYDDILYKVLTDHTSQADWTPDAAPSLFAKVLIPDKNVIPEWEQPDSTNPYSKGNKVTHNGKTWRSTIDGNVWEPGVYGWEEITE
ncbi:carbohydrate-binding protein [Dialister sp.]|uniref:carbohydrate-binding protein n=1 Tax=Dialister sp. TaxID=1955814 RepID=UPI00406D520B